MKRFKKALSLLIVTMMVVTMFTISNVTTVAANATLSPTSATVYCDCKARSQATFYSGFANTQINQLNNWSRLRLTAGDTNEYESHTYDCYGWTEGVYTVQIAAGGQNWYSTPYGWLTLDNWGDGWRDAGTLTVLSGGHTWNEGTVTTAPTCTESGSELFTCTSCGVTKTESIDPVGHSYSSSVIAPTCTAEGYTSYRCTVCGDVYSDTYTSALGHDWDEGYVYVEPTLDTMGTTRYTCTRCDVTMDVVDIPVLSGLDIQIFLANEMIEKYMNGEFVTTRPGFDSAWARFTDVYYNAVTVAEDGTPEEKDTAEQALAAEIASITKYLPIDVTELEAAVALTPQKAESFYTPESYSLWSTYRIQAYMFLSKASSGEKSLADETEMNDLVRDLTAAYNNLTLKDADYSAVDELLAEYAALNRNSYSPEDLEYTDTIIANNVVRGYKIDRQSDVDNMAGMVSYALRYLASKVLYADTTQLEAAVTYAGEKIAQMQSGGYEIVPEQLSALNALLEEAGSMQNVSADMQERVDALAQSIIQAADSLEYAFAISDETTATIEGDLIFGFEEGMSESDIRSMIGFVGAANMEIVETPNGLGTGTQIIFTDNDGNVIDQFTVVVFGDANGDGWIDVFDTAVVTEIANSGEDVDEYVNKALDVNGDGFIDAFDTAIIMSITNMEVSISQDGNLTLA